MTDETRLQVPPVPAAVAALKQDGRVEGDKTQDRGKMERTMSQGIREEREDLKEAAEQNLNVILDVGLDGMVRWVSSSWLEVVGTDPGSVEGKLISETLLEDKDAFANAVEKMKKDNSRSQRVKFSVEMGSASKLAPDPTAAAVHAEEEGFRPEETMEQMNTMVLEGQGIMVYDRSSGGESHTMWMLRPSTGPREIMIDLPRVLVDSLGVGAEVLAQHLTALAEAENDPDNYEPPQPVLCRICERQIPPWWFEKHSELCLQEHQAEMEVQMAQEGLTDHRNVIVKILDALEARSNGPTSGEISASPLSPAEYKGLVIGSSNSSSGPSSGTASPVIVANRSREPSVNRLGHVRARSVAVRRPFSRIVEMVLDLCDTALEINTPAVQESKDDPEGGIRTLSEESEKSISQVLTWQKPSTQTLDQEPGLAALCTDTEAAARLKVDNVLRHRQILEYSERLRIEFSLLVQECIDEAMHKAAKIVAGELTSSSDESEHGTVEEDDDQRSVTQEDGSFFSGSFDGPSSLSNALQNASDPALHSGRPTHLSAEASTRSSSPKESVTPRSHRESLIASRARSTSKRSSMYFESDAGDSDGGSVRSSLLASSRRGESPAPNERRLSRALSSRDRHRRSMILTGAVSPQRQPSPSGGMPPPSPMRSAKPHPLDRRDNVNSPITSPVFSAGEFSSPPPTSRHHRRQSSAVSVDMRPPVSPRLNSVSQPQARAVPPSIKDFEIIKPISKGAFGSVYLSKKKSTGDYFAIKVLKKADMVAKNQVTNVKAERAIMMWQGESEFVAKLYWTFSSKDYLYLVMEYLNGGDCASLIKVLGGLPEDWAKKYLAEVVLGMEHLHGRGIVHRDLKPDNLLIDQNGHLKLTDFGLSRMGLIGRQKRVLNSTTQDSAPDLLKQGPFSRTISMASSRSTSFDLQGYHSPSSTPQMTPDAAAGQAFPSYFNLNRDQSWGREHSRHASGRSDSGGSESLQAMFGHFSLNESVSFHAGSGPPQRRSVPEEEAASEGSGSPDLFTLQPSISNVSIGQPDNTPPQPSMMPPPMALFDPEDRNRRFVGTPDYLAPETVNGVGQDEMSDWWSLGCILFEFLYGYPPFHADTPEKVFANILARRIDWPDEDLLPVSPEARDLMNRLMTLDPHERLGSNHEEKYASAGEEVRKHPWFEGLNWETLLQDEAQFVPSSEDPENTEYFDARGATLQSFAEELEDQSTSPAITPGAEMPARPYDSLSKVRTQVNSMKRGLMPLHIPPHVRESRSRRLSEPVVADDFGNFTFKNLPVLEKANKDVIQKLRAEAMQAQSKGSPAGTSSSAITSPSPSLENSPVLQMPLKRALSTTSKGGARPASPSTLSQANSSPSRASQPSSPLLVSFVAGQHHERRKTSSTASSMSQPSSGSLQPSSLMDIPRLNTGPKSHSSATSPIKPARIPAPLVMSPSKGLSAPRAPGSATTTSRARSHTVGSQEGDSLARDMYVQQKRRSGVFDMSPSSSDNEDSRANALLRVQRRRQSSRRLSQINMLDGPMFRPLDVLICEDHPVSRLVMEALLEKLRCRTITVGNGDEATRYAMSDVKFDIIMMEFKLPRINGADVARMVRDTKNANSHTPIVAVTGYLKELQAPHHFDAMIEKPPTTSKLAEVMSRLCHWAPPPPGGHHNLSSNFPGVPPSGLRQESVRSEDSPSSTSSGYAHLPGSTFRGSSREDSISSSFFGDVESVMADDVPVIINAHRQGDDWGGDTSSTGLGITEEALVDATKGLSLSPAAATAAGLPHLIHQQSAPPTMQQARPLGRQRSAEKIKAKREVMAQSKRLQGGESGDDEDEELGNVQVRTRSPISRGPRTSKLGLEMMRTNSRGSVVSNSDIASAAAMLASTSPPKGHVDRGGEEGEGEGMGEHPATITPPEIFSKATVGEGVEEFDMDRTPQGPRVAVEEPTPRASGKI